MQTRIVMPQLGESVTEGTVDRWLKREGDRVRKDEPLVEVVTDKVSAEVPSPVEGTLVKILISDGQTVPCRTEIALVEGIGANSDEAAPTPAAGAARTTDGPDNGQAPAMEGEEPAARRASPVVRRIAEQHGVDLAAVRGSGHEGRLRKEDVLAYLEQRQGTGAPVAAPAPAPGQQPPTAPPLPSDQPAQSAQPAASAIMAAPTAGSTTTEPATQSATGVPAPMEEGDRRRVLPLTPARRAIAEHMLRSIQTAPQVTTAIEIDMSAVARLRERARAAFRQRQGVELTFLPFFMRAVVRSLGAHPLLNATWTDAGIALLRDVHLGIAVAVPAQEGRVGTENLMVPVIRHADRLNVRGLALAAADLASRARSGALTPDDLRDATFTVNNTGALGSVLSTPILPVGQAGIITLEAVVKRPVVLTDAEGGDGIAIRHLAYSCLTFDHRILDGMAALRYLKEVKAEIESAGPQWLEEGGESQRLDAPW